MTQTQTIENRIREFVLKQFPLARKNGLQPADKWLENGLLDSMGVLDLVHFLEEEFSIQVSDEELAPEHFQSLASVTGFAEKKISSNARAKE
ncbi:MAG TPA: acyl carrier protein [Methylomirabilota bacterium]|nr:acyl carrier protein [Methylomirabilota bacterium]